MKNIAIVLMLLAGLCCCKIDRAPGESGLLLGSWELRRSDGGIAGTINYPPGNGYILRFSEGSQYSFIWHSEVWDSGAFLLTRASGRTWRLQLKSSGSSGVSSSTIILNGSTLVFLPSAECCDIPTSTYSRL